MTDEQYYDLLVVGAGTGGYSAALKAAEKKLKVGIVEQDQVGGTCLNRGCIPTKTYLHLAKKFRMLASDLSTADIDGISIDRKLIADRIALSVNQLTKGLLFSLEKNDIDIFYGMARAECENRIRVYMDEGKSICLSYGYLLLATGAEPIIPENVEVNENIFTTDNAFIQENIAPESIVIVGGGVIGVEFASILSCFGTSVTLIESRDTLVYGFSKEVSATVKGMLQKQGVVVKTGTSVCRISEEDGEAYLELEDVQGVKENILAEKVLIAIGRKARVDESFFNVLGIRMDGSRIAVDINGRTSNENVYAVGDVCSPIQLAYVAANQGEQVVDVILGNPANNTGSVPKCIFMSTEVAQVGVSEENVDGNIAPFVTARVSLKANSMGVLQGHTEGYVKLIADKSFGKIIGAEMVCPHAVDMIELCKNYIDHGYSVQDLVDSIYPHPSYVEIIRDVAKILVREIKAREE